MLLYNIICDIFEEILYLFGGWNVLDFLLVGGLLFLLVRYWYREGLKDGAEHERTKTRRRY